MTPVRIVGALIALVGSLGGCGFELRADSGVDAGDDAAIDPDAAPEAPPRLIPGGGIGDGPIQGVVNVYVVDELTGGAIAGAAIDVGGITGVTDATGLFIARATSLTGPQTVLATLANYRAALWIGVAGANVTIALKPAPLPAVPRASVAGTITGFATPPVAVNHYKLGSVAYSASDLALTEENELRTPGSTNLCAGATCPFTVTTRTGSLALFAGVYDVDTKGTGSDNDDTATLITWAYKTGITVLDGMNQTGQALTMLAPSQLGDVTVNFGTPPAGLPAVFALPGLELGVDGVMNLLQIATPAAPTIRIPGLATFPGATYRLIAVAGVNINQLTAGALSIVTRRGITGSSFVAGAWMTPPAMVMASRTAVTWIGASGATIHTVEYRQGAVGLLAISTFDGSTSATLPAAVVLPATALEVEAGAIRSTFDVTSFGFEQNVGDIDGIASSAPLTVN